MLDCQRWEKVRFVAASLCSLVKDGKKYDLLPPGCAQRWEEVRFVATSLCSKMGRSTICCHQFAVLDCQRWEEVRFVATSLCSSVRDGKHDLLPPACAGLPKMGRSTICCHQFVLKDGKKCDLLPPVCAQRWGKSTICCHQFVPECQRWEKVRFVATSFAVLDCQRWEEVRFVATSLCSRCQRWEKVRFVATSLCSSVKEGKKYVLLPPVCSDRWSKMGRSTICCHQFVLDCRRWEEVRFVATSLCSIVKDGKKYDLLPPVCGPRLSKIGRSTICCHQFVLKDGKKYDWLPPVCGARLSKMGKSTICCHQFVRVLKMGKSTICCHQFAVLDCQRWEEVRFVATQFVLDCQRWEEVRFVATSLCSIVKDGKKYDLLPPV